MTGELAAGYDVVVVGGGPAGLSAALTLGRARRSVLVVDAGTPRNAAAGHVHNYLAREGMSPGELLATGRAEVAGYGGEVVTGTVTAAAVLADQEDGGDFRVALADGRVVRARRLLVTTGLVDELPDVPGLAERWGRDVLHCPCCHGWEVRDQALGVLGTGPLAAHQALLFRQWSADVTLFLHTGPPPSEVEWEQLAARDVAVVAGEVAALEVTDDRLTGVRLRSGRVVPRQALVVAPRFLARAEVLASLGLRATEQELGGYVYGSSVPADPTGATAVPGVWVAGNVADVRAQVISSAAAGLNTAAAINADLIAEDTRRAVAAGMFSQRFWDERYGSSSALWSGEPNAQLVAEVSDLSPGRALDIGSGEGADALWLAGRGWRVTAVDVSRVALDRGAARATQAGSDVAGRVDWRHVDLLHWAPEAQTYDLVTAQFMHLPPAPREALIRRLAASVAPGGALLVVGHHASDPQVTEFREQFPGLFFTAADIAGLVAPDEWKILVADVRDRVVEADGQTVTKRDAVLRAQRLG